ncbi:MAG: putative glycosyl transferase, family 2 [Leptospirillum rubarum]|jgi:cellulose synthase/poly-beta-1,6-N-acetylglucosamine synthase-like glycosyltransferase|nr:MAG: putative glycosyl transferase, family 2 [Leptospirillum rubarum]
MTSTVSVLTTLFNHQEYIVEALNSAITQSYPPKQIVVFDDASSDESVKLAKQICDPRIEIHLGNYNLGGPNTVKGLSLCRGDYVAILNSDDCWAKDKLKHQVEYLDSHPKCGAIFTHVQIIDENSQPWQQGTNPLEFIFATTNRSRFEWLNHFFLYGNAFCASSVVVRREIFDQLGLFDGRYIQLQDFEMWLRIALAGYDLYVIDRPLTMYRVMRTGSNMSAANIRGKSLYEFEYSKILQNFWKIRSLVELRSIFPEITISEKADDSLVLFYLAKFASQLPSWHHKMFAIETMSKWGGNLHSMTLAYECHNFSHKSYIDFLSNGPIKELFVKSWKWKVEIILKYVISYSSMQIIKIKLKRILNTIKISSRI